MAVDITSSRGRRLGLEELTTPQVLALYERLFGPLQAQTRQRILEASRHHGWDDRTDRLTKAA